LDGATPPPKYLRACAKIFHVRKKSLGCPNGCLGDYCHSIAAVHLKSAKATQYKYREIVIISDFSGSIDLIGLSKF